MLEAYQAYADYNDMATLTRELVQEAAEQVFGSTVVRHADGSERDLGAPWREITLYGAVSVAVGVEVGPGTPRERLPALADKHGVGVDPNWSDGKVVEEIFEALVVPTLTEPTFVRDYPEDTTPLTRAHRQTPGLTEKWDLYVAGVELATAYSELVDRLSRGNASCSSRYSLQRATLRPCNSTRTSCVRWSTACPRPGEWAWESTGS